MQIPSWAFTSAGKSLFGYKSEPDLVIVQIPITLDILVEPHNMPLEILPVQPDILVEPVIYEPTLYDEFIELIRKNTLIQLLIELYT